MPLAFRRALGGFLLLLLWLVVVVIVELFGMRGRRGPRDADIIQKTEDGRAREPGHPAPRGGREEALRGPGTPARRPAPVPPPSRDPDGTPPHPTCRRAPP